MLASLFVHWRSTLAGVLSGALGAFATTANLDKMSAAQALACFGACLLMAVKGAVSADASEVAKAAASSDAGAGK